MALPTRLYYPLDLAAKEIGCDINELLHFASIGVLEICIAAPEPPDGWDDDDKLDDNPFEPRLYVNKLKLNKTKSIVKLNYETMNTKISASYNFKTRSYAHLDISGLIAIPFLYIKNFDCFGNDTITVNHFNLPRTETKIEISENLTIKKISTDDYKVNVKSFTISAEELTLLKNGGKYLEKIQFPIEINNETLLTQEKPKRRANENKQALFIKGLIAVCFDNGEQILENPTTPIDTGIIKRKFDSAGLETGVCGKTVTDWLENVELKRTAPSEKSKSKIVKN
ncbi:hypothetical protein I2494_06745 [Budviciaceae bacterium BWR-B9]|uniref:Uncharacterized protein n=1 Tax=Limnobaculum allomyrinae TaxID=2791986 RepID=A0ABS1IP34_9GAMM|nr:MULTISPECIES: hypothetical protein [Limnobaculum]MBK5143419.1 hypothetical protein [Limnobaculum allomyrinae]MBV7691307.1 hypothetical protein [Limnobaculum sp. M2-1]